MALHYAAAKGHLDVERALLADPRTDSNKENYHNTTPLILASGNGNIEVVEELLSHPRTDPNFEVSISRVISLASQIIVETTDIP